MTKDEMMSDNEEYRDQDKCTMEDDEKDRWWIRAMQVIFELIALEYSS